MMKSNQGQTLVEIMVALGILVLVVVALVGVTTFASRNAQFSRNQALATKFSQQGIEEIRSCRDDASWNDFKLHWSSCWAPSLPSPFSYQVDCSFPDSETAQIAVTVSWTDSKGTHSSQVTTRLTNWRSAYE